MDSYNLQIRLFSAILQAMTIHIRLLDELGRELSERRKALRMSQRGLAEKSGKVREVMHRLETGQDTTVSSLLAVLSALGLALHLESVGLPTSAEVASRFEEDDDAS